MLLILTECGGLFDTHLPCSVDEYYTDTLSSDPYTADFKRVMSAFKTKKPIVRDDRAYHASFKLESLIHSGGTLEYTLTPSVVSEHFRFCDSSCYALFVCAAKEWELSASNILVIGRFNLI